MGRKRLGLLGMLDALVQEDRQLPLAMAFALSVAASPLLAAGLALLAAGRSGGEGRGTDDDGAAGPSSHS